MVDLHEFIVSLGTQVALLKLDVEGAEVEILNRLIDQKSIFNIRKVLVETHEKQIPELFQPTKELKQKIAAQGITHVNLNWV